MLDRSGGYSRFIVHWEIRERSTERDVEIVLQRAREKFPGTTPRIISDNGPQFVSREFKQYIRICGMTHVRTSPYYPQSNGKLERYHRTIKVDCIRPGCPLTRHDAQRIVTKFVEDYNERRLHSYLGYVTPRDKLLGREQEIFADRDRKLEAARERRKQERQDARNPEICYTAAARSEDRALLGSNPSAFQDWKRVRWGDNRPPAHWPAHAFGTMRKTPGGIGGWPPITEKTAEGPCSFYSSTRTQRNSTSR
jgi:putative transposase